MARKKKPSGQRKLPLDPTRRQGRRLDKRLMLIVCEGESTEPIYFKALHQSLRDKNIQIEVVGSRGRTSAMQVVDRALTHAKNREKVALNNTKKSKFDEVWCVFDCENITTNPSFVQAVAVAKQNQLKLAVSNPAFEYWYLLHFEETIKSFKDATELTRQLKKHIPKYEKPVNVFALLQPMTTDAIARSERILKNLPDKNNHFRNPSTHVHKLVEQLID